MPLPPSPEAKPILNCEAPEPQANITLSPSLVVCHRYRDEKKCRISVSRKGIITIVIPEDMEEPLELTPRKILDAQVRGNPEHCKQSVSATGNSDEGSEHQNNDTKLGRQDHAKGVSNTNENSSRNWAKGHPGYAMPST